MVLRGTDHATRFMVLAAIRLDVLGFYFVLLADLLEINLKGL